MTTSPQLQEVFKTGGLPTYTFVEPVEFNKLLVALRTPGRCIVVEGPSGIGKTTALKKALDSATNLTDAELLSARKEADLGRISELANGRMSGSFIVDDFHKLSPDLTRRFADLMKVAADEERDDLKIVVLGINDAGKSLIDLAPDLAMRVEVIRFDSNPDEKVEELLAKGESALRISINIKDEIVRDSRGSFYIAQMLGHETCLIANVLERGEERQALDVSYEMVRGRLVAKLELRFREATKLFARGNRFRKYGRAPYLHILNWLGESGELSIRIADHLRKHPELTGSVGQVVQKNYVTELLQENPLLA